MVRELPGRLRQEIVDCGYYPELVADGLAMTLGAETVLDHLVHHEATFNSDEVQRHLTVLALTEQRLVVSHTDESSEGDLEHAAGEVRAISSTESIPLSAITSVGLTRVVREPHRFGQVARPVVETWLTLGWGTMRRLNLEPATCGDPQCDADHGYAGSLVADDLVVRMSPFADGEDAVARLVAFGTAMQCAVGHR
ncbi:DUF5998 family protein [Aestuariimicrobium ganziense]|uniref:DUF5998 family protein n=1 Tax=Aestuariimicrobium ganziense TaxID=2773677 RepID=UPI001942E2E9|nr:DUF5998 family protein [Aestuariimicrobium ganziense]